MRIQKTSTTARNMMLCIIVSYLLVQAFRVSPIVSGDTVALAQNAESLVKCARDVHFLGCSGTNQFGLLQNIPAFLLAWKGWSTESIVACLGLLNIVAFLALVMIVWRVVDQRLRFLAVLFIIAGPLVGYAAFTFGEMLQTLVIVGFVAAVIRNRPVWIMTCGILATTTRETAFIPLLLLGLACLAGRRTRDKKARQHEYLMLYSSIFSGVLLLVLFNYWKFATWKNTVHMNSLFVVPGLWKKAETFVAVWLAPGGGLAPFWLVGMLVGVIVPFVVLKIGTRNEKISGLWLLSSLLVASGSLASWYAPFGWVAWGPRLIMPSIAAAGVASFLLFRDRILGLSRLRNVVRQLTAVSISAAAAFSASASIGFLQNPSAINSFFGPDASCPRPAVIQEDPPYYFYCLRHGSWKIHPSLWSTGFNSLNSVSVVMCSILMVLIYLALVSLGRPVRSDVEDQNLS